MVEKKLYEIICRSLGLELEIQPAELDAESLHEWDSVNHIKLIMNLESTYNITIPFDVIPTLTSFEKINQFLSSSNS